MTRATKSDAIFRSSIHLYIVYVMDIITKLSADSACIFISLSNGFLKIFTPFFWIKLPTSFSALPTMRIFSNSKLYKTSPRTIFVVALRRALSEFFPARFANNIHIYFSVNIMAFRGTKLIRRTCTGTPSPFLAANNTLIIRFAAIPKPCILSDAHKFFASAGVGTKTSLISSRIDNLKRFFAILASFINHIFTLTGASRFISQYCCSGNTDETRRVMCNINLTNCICLNN